MSMLQHVFFCRSYNQEKKHARLKENAWAKTRWKLARRHSAMPREARQRRSRQLRVKEK